MLLGADAVGTMCARQSKPGLDVYTNNPLVPGQANAFTFASDWPRIEEILVAGTATVAQNTPISFPSPGYIPLFSMWLADGGTYSTEMEQRNWTAGGSISMRGSAFVPYILLSDIASMRWMPNIARGTVSMDGVHTFDYVVWKLFGGP